MEERRGPGTQQRTTEQKVDAVQGGVGAPPLKEYAIPPYALVVTVHMDPAVWPKVWYSWLSLKGHLQGFHYVQATYQFVSRVEDEMAALFIVVCESAEAVAAWLSEGYTVDAMLREMGVPEANFQVRMMRDFS